MIRFDDAVQVGDAVQRSEMRNGLVLGQVLAIRRALLALNGAAETAVFLDLIGLADRRPGVVDRCVENGPAEIFRRRHAPLPHQIDQRRRAVLGDAELTENHRRGLEQAHDILAGGLQALRIGYRRFPVAVDDYRLEILAPHNGAEAAAADRIALSHHDIGKQHPVFAGRPDRRHAPPPGQGGHRRRDLRPPQRLCIQEFNPLRRNGQHRRPRRLAGEDQSVDAGALQPPGEAAAGRAVVDRAGQGGAGNDRQARRRRCRRAAEGTDGKDQRHLRRKRVEAIEITQ